MPCTAVPPPATVVLVLALAMSWMVLEVSVPKPVPAYCMPLPTAVVPVPAPLILAIVFDEMVVGATTPAGAVPVCMLMPFSRVDWTATAGELMLKAVALLPITLLVIVGWPCDMAMPEMLAEPLPVIPPIV